MIGFTKSRLWTSRPSYFCEATDLPLELQNPKAGCPGGPVPVGGETAPKNRVLGTPQIEHWSEQTDANKKSMYTNVQQQTKLIIIIIRSYTVKQYLKQYLKQLSSYPVDHQLVLYAYLADK